MGVYGISARNVREALPRGIALLLRKGEQDAEGYSFAEGPVAITFRRPKQHVLLGPVREVNPFVYLIEALWTLYGNGETGDRLRSYFGLDQLDSVIELLRREPATDRAVLALWDAEDLDEEAPPFNLSAAFRRVDGKLEMTVFSRSTDLILGICGGDAVRFALLLEYVAAMVGLPMGRYTQVVSNFRMSAKGWKAIERRAAITPIDDAETVYSELETASEDYGETLPLVGDPASFDADLDALWKALDRLRNGKVVSFEAPANPFLAATYGMALAYHYHQHKDHETALAVATQIAAPDWRRAAMDWLTRRIPVSAS